MIDLVCLVLVDGARNQLFESFVEFDSACIFL